MLDSSMRAAQRLRPDWAGFVLCAYGCAVLASGPLGWRAPAVLVAGATPMQPMSAAAVALLGAAIVLLQRGSSRAMRAARWLLAAVGALALAVLVEWALGIDLGFDRLLDDPFPSPLVPVPGRMGPDTAATLLLLTASFALLSGAPRRDGAILAAFLAAGAGVLAGAVLLGFVSGLVEHYGWSGLTHMALPTALCVLLAAIVAFRSARRRARRTGEGSGWLPILSLLTGAVATALSVRAVLHARGDGAAGTPVEPAVWLVLIGGSAVALLWALSVRRGELLGARGQALEQALRAVERSSAALAESEAVSRRLAQDLGRSNEDLERFAYVASHDLQEPLRMVKSYVQLIERRYGAVLDGDAREFIAFAVDGALRMERMITDLLALSRVERKGAPLEPVPLAEPLAAALANLRLTIEESTARIETGELPTALVDRAQITMLLQNLIGNAIKFRRPGAPPSIRIAAAERDGAWDLTVSDDGPGIAAENRERIFEIFYRAAGRETPGTGIGLALCRRIAERHGGRIWVESEVGRGSAFHVRLPRPDAFPDRLGKSGGSTV